MLLVSTYVNLKHTSNIKCECIYEMYLYKLQYKTLNSYGVILSHNWEKKIIIFIFTHFFLKTKIIIKENYFKILS